VRSEGYQAYGPRACCQKNPTLNTTQEVSFLPFHLNFGQAKMSGAGESGLKG
jgi:hypothetical protein